MNKIRVIDECRCAYCGCELEYEKIQIDHIKSVYANTDFEKNMTDREMYSMDNLLPSCRQCNFYKSSYPLETFRERLTTVMMKNVRENFGYRLALKYGLIEEQNKPITFYFEIETIKERINRGSQQ